MGYYHRDIGRKPHTLRNFLFTGLALIGVIGAGELYRGFPLTDSIINKIISKPTRTAEVTSNAEKEGSIEVIQEAGQNKYYQQKMTEKQVGVVKSEPNSLMDAIARLSGEYICYNDERRQDFARVNGISGKYTGSKAQNIYLLNLLHEGKADISMLQTLDRPYEGVLPTDRMIIIPKKMSPPTFDASVDDMVQDYVSGIGIEGSLTNTEKDIYTHMLIAETVNDYNAGRGKKDYSTQSLLNQYRESADGQLERFSSDILELAGETDRAIDFITRWGDIKQNDLLCRLKPTVSCRRSAG